MDIRKIELEIVALSHSVTQNQGYAIVLGETDGTRRLPIVIGGFEAQAIAVAMERMVPNRPLTHDLLKNFLDSYQIDLKEVVINNLHEGVFYAQLVCFKEGKTIEIDSRTSDALAMAVRFDCPIYTFENILDAAGVTLEDEARADGPRKKPRRSSKSSSQVPKEVSIESMDDATLNEHLESALSAEDYEKAAEIRDELTRRQSNS